MNKQRLDKLNALRSELASLKGVKLSKYTNTEKIAELEKQIDGILRNEPYDIISKLN